MKKIITSILLLTFCFEPVTFAAGVSGAEARVRGVQNEDEYVNLNAFEKNYQESIESNTKKTSMSPIEQMFNGKDEKVVGEPLLQAGYNMFTESSTGATTGGKYSDSYKLSIGEKVNVYTMGESVDIMAMSGTNLISPSMATQVDSKGNLFISGIGVIKAENRTIGEVENEANRLARQKYKSLKVKLTVASGGEFSVFVYGQVNKPGKVLVGNNSSVLDALNAAGGVKKTGTLRNIKYTYASNNMSKNVDLYNALFLGNDGGIILRPNDKIFVGKIGNVAALKNGVTVPGIYEFKDGENLQNIVSFAGGFLPATQVSELTLTGFDTQTKQRLAKNVSWNDAKNTKLTSGDSVEFRELYNTAENIVTIQGNVKHPATYAYKEGMRLSDILKSEDELLEETFINQAVIRRVTGPNNQIETIPVFLKEFFAGMNDPVLKPKDVISIYKNTNSQFVDVYGCINKPKHLTYKSNMTLFDLMPEIQFLESYTDNNVAEENSSKNSDTNVAYKGSVEENQTQLLGATANTNKLIPAENVAVEITNSSGDTQVYYLYDIMINSDRVKSISIAPEDKVFFRTLRENEVLKSVKVSGFVKTPGVYKFVEGKHLIDVIKESGGLNKDADLRGIVFKRNNLKYKQVELAKKNNDKDIKLLEGRLASGYKQSEADQQTKMDMISMLKDEKGELDNKYTGQIALNIKNNDLDKISKLDNVELQDGDDIYIPRMSNQVSIIGEVYNEQSFIYKSGAKAKSYIKQVGGYTPNANRFRLYKVGVNGRAEKIHGWTKLAQGDTIVVPRRIAGNDWLTPLCDTLKGLASILATAFVVTRW